MRVKSKSAVLHMLLGSPNYISGQELANRLGSVAKPSASVCSNCGRKGTKLKPPSVWVISSGRQQFGYGRGAYPRLHCPLEPIYYATVDSTNTEAKRLLNAGYRGNFLVVADEQTAGRGRQGKQFYSPRGTGIYMTMVVHHGRRLQDAVSVTTAAGVAVCRAIEN